MFWNYASHIHQLLLHNKYAGVREQITTVNIVFLSTRLQYLLGPEDVGPPGLAPKVSCIKVHFKCLSSPLVQQMPMYVLFMVRAGNPERQTALQAHLRSQSKWYPGSIPLNKANNMSRLELEQKECLLPTQASKQWECVQYQSNSLVSYTCVARTLRKLVKVRKCNMVMCFSKNIYDN